MLKLKLQYFGHLKQKANLLEKTLMLGKIEGRRRRGQQWIQNFPQFIVIHTVKGFGIVNKAEIDVFLELSCFFHGPADVGNLISGSSAFSKTSLNIWKFRVHVLLKPGLENFEHPGVSGDIWGSQEGCQGPFRSSGRNRGLPLRRRRGQGPHLAKR